MKRITALLICLSIMLSMLASCAKKEEEPEDTVEPETSNTEQETEEKEEKEEKEETVTDKKETENTPAKTEEKKQETAKTETKTETKTEEKTETPSNEQTAMEKFDKNESNAVTSETVTETVTEEIPKDDDLSEVTFDTSDGEVDTRYQNNDDGVKYETNVASGVENVSYSASDLDEALLTLPVIKINTLDGSGVTSKTEYKSANISVTNTSAAYTMNNYAVEIRGRGNSTWQQFDKKAYKLKFVAPQDMFGMGSGKKWVLLANALDETMLRNYLTLSLAKSLGVKFATDCQFVSLFLNGEYKGVYLLCEQVQEGENRVDVNTSKTGEVDTGYFLEGINNSQSVDYRTFKLGTVNGKSLGKGGNFQFIIKSPTNLECTTEQYNFIVDLVSNANSAIFNMDWAAIQQYCDIDSFVNMFIVNEVSLNNDMGYSFYLYREKGGKLSIGPVWDYDQAMGSSTHGGNTYKGWYAGSELQWFTTLIEMPEFKALVKQKYSSCKAAIDSTVTKIDSTVNKYRYDFAMDEALWANYGEKRWRITPDLIKLNTYNDHLSYLKTWLTNRIRWMDHELGI